MIKKIRTSLGLRIKDVSERSGIPYRTVQDWELYHKGQRTLQTAKKLADALGCKIEDLIED